jgi:RNA polymerase sigma-70 factor (ECF subfamily)
MVEETNPATRLNPEERIAPMVLEQSRQESPELYRNEPDRDRLIEACQTGDSDALRALFDRHKDRIYSIALRYSGDPASAQDIAQETFLKLFAGIGSFRGASGFDSWLYRLVVNACFDHKRKTRRLLPLIDGLLDFVRAPGPTVLDDVLRAELTGNLLAAVQTLPPDQRMLIVLRYSQSLSYEQLAEVFGCSTGTVASRLNRVHKLLERRLFRLRGMEKNRV